MVPVFSLSDSVVATMTLNAPQAFLCTCVSCRFPKLLVNIFGVKIIQLNEPILETSLNAFRPVDQGVVAILDPGADNNRTHKRLLFFFYL